MRILYLIKTIARIIKYYFFGYKRYLNIFLLIIKNKPKKIIEIGVYRGTRSLEMIDCAKIFNADICYFGFDLFDDFENSILNKEASKKPLSIKEIKRKLGKHNNINLIKGRTDVTLKSFLKHNKMSFDLIFIDGGHSIQTIANDWKYSERLIALNGVIVLDDYYLNNNKIIKKYGCNFLLKKFCKRYVFKESLFCDWAKIDNNKVKVKMINVIKKK